MVACILDLLRSSDGHIRILLPLTRPTPTTQASQAPTDQLGIDLVGFVKRRQRESQLTASSSSKPKLPAKLRLITNAAKKEKIVVLPWGAFSQNTQVVDILDPVCLWSLPKDLYLHAVLVVSPFGLPTVLAGNLPQKALLASWLRYKKHSKAPSIQVKAPSPHTVAVLFGEERGRKRRRRGRRQRQARRRVHRAAPEG